MVNNMATYTFHVIESTGSPPAAISGALCSILAYLSQIPAYQTYTGYTDADGIAQVYVEEAFVPKMWTVSKSGYVSKSGSTFTILMTVQLAVEVAPQIYTCPVCGQTFTDFVLFSQHMKTHPEIPPQLDFQQWITVTLPWSALAFAMVSDFFRRKS